MRVCERERKRERERDRERGRGRDSEREKQREREREREREGEWNACSWSKIFFNFSFFLPLSLPLKYYSFRKWLLKELLFFDALSLSVCLYDYLDRGECLIFLFVVCPVFFCLLEFIFSFYPIYLKSVINFQCLAFFLSACHSFSPFPFSKLFFCVLIYWFFILHRRFTTCRQSFSAWKMAYEELQRKNIQKMKSVKPNRDKIILRFFWHRWIVRAQEEEMEREVRNRSAASWHKVQGWLKQEKEYWFFNL